jgi:hypothetical protein
MVINFRTCRINQGTHKLVGTSTLIKKIITKQINIIISQENITL